MLLARIQVLRLLTLLNSLIFRTIFHYCILESLLNFLILVLSLRIFQIIQFLLKPWFNRSEFIQVNNEAILISKLLGLVWVHLRKLPKVNKEGVAEHLRSDVVVEVPHLFT
jgi:hypothetical protein